MKILLDYKIDIDVREGDTSKEKLSIFYREFNPAEKREQDVLKKRFRDIFSKAQKIGKKMASLDQKAELHKLNGDYSKSIKAIESRDKLEKDLEKLDDELEEIGGGDENAFAEEAAKKRFGMLVSGSDKNKLASYAEIKGYVKLMRDLDIAKAELEKKQSGE